jgi:hypothetical protein
MEDIDEEKYNYGETKKYILDLIKQLVKLNPANEEDIKKLSESLDYILQAVKDLGIPFIYLIISNTIHYTEKNLGSVFVSLYYEEIERNKLEKIFLAISDAFNFKVPEELSKEYSKANSIEKDFLENITFFASLDDKNEIKIPRTELNELEIIYYKLTSIIDKFNSYIEVNEKSEEMENDIKSKYEKCQKEFENFKNTNQKNLKYNLNFFDELFNLIDLSRLDKKKEDIKDIKDDDIELSDEELNKINVNINDSNNNLSLSLSKSFSEHFEKIKLKDRKYFILNERVSQGEDLEIEFKYYKFFEKNNIAFKEEHTATITRLICGLLNNKGGRIYFGINDDKYVIGNYLSYKQRDDLRVGLINLTSNFYPECKSSKVSVHFIPIKNSNRKFLNDRYVTKMIVKQGDTDKLYSISQKEYISFKRLQGMVTPLRSEVIADEIYKRKNNPEKQIPENEFIDPEPDEIVEENNNLKFFDENLYKDNNNFDFYGKDDNGKKRKRKKKNQKNLISIKIKNINLETPVFLLEEQFKEYSDIIEKTIFFETNGFSQGFGYIQVRDMDSANKLINKFNNFNIYGSKIKLFIAKNKY